MKIHARITMELNLKDASWKEIYERIKANDPGACRSLYIMFERYGKVDTTYGDNYIPGSWLAYDMTGNEDADGFEDIDLHSN